MLVTILECPTRAKVKQPFAEDISTPPGTALDCLLDKVAHGSSDTTKAYDRYGEIIKGLYLEWIMKFILSLPESDWFNTSDLVDVYEALIKGNPDDIASLLSKCKILSETWRNSPNEKSAGDFTPEYLGGFAAGCLSGSIGFGSLDGVWSKVYEVLGSAVESNIAPKHLSEFVKEVSNLRDSYTDKFVADIDESLAQVPLAYDTHVTESVRKESCGLNSGWGTLNRSLKDSVVGHYSHILADICAGDVTERFCSMLWEEWEPVYVFKAFTTPGFE